MNLVKLVDGYQRHGGARGQEEIEGVNVVHHRVPQQRHYCAKRPVWYRVPTQKNHKK